jgi:hypothetical protein
MQAFVQIPGQDGKHGVVGKPLEQLADVGDPEGAFESGADFLEALRNQKLLL